MLMNGFIDNDTSVPTAGTGLVVRAGAVRPTTAPLFTPTDGLVSTHWRPRLD